MKIPAAKAAVDKELEKLEKISAWNLTKVRSKSEVIDEARTKGSKVHFASLMDICHLKNAELETKHQKYKGRVVFRGDIVKDDSGSYAVFTEQGSSASQMTAAKIMDSISRLPGCAGQAADAVSAYTQVKMEDAPKLFKKIQNRNVQTFGFVHHETNGRKHGPVWKTQSFLLSDIFMVILWQDCYGKGNLRKSYWSTFGRRFPIGNAYSYTVKKGFFLSVCVDDIKFAGKKQNINPMWKVLNKEVDLGEPTSFLDHVYLGCTQRQCEISKDVVDNNRNMFESRISQEQLKKTMLGNYAYFFVVIWHGGSCKEMCGTILWVGKQDDSTTLQSINSMHWWSSFQRRSIEIRGRIVKSMLSNGSDMFALGTHWKTWYSIEQTCTIDHKTDQSLWRTIISVDILHSWYMWIQTILSCGKHCQTMQIGTVSRLRLCGIFWRFKSYCRWNIVFSEATRSFQSAGCVRNKLQFRTVQQNQKSFL